MKCKYCNIEMYKVYARPKGRWTTLPDFYYCVGCDLIFKFNLQKPNTIKT